MTDEQKEEMKEELKTVYKYDMFIDENPDVQERVKLSRAQALVEGKAEGRAEGKVEGRAEGMQSLILVAIKNRFPTLATQVQPLIEQIQDTKKLEKLFLQLASATTENEVRQLLKSKKVGRRKQ